MALNSQNSRNRHWVSRAGLMFALAICVFACGEGNQKENGAGGDGGRASDGGGAGGTGGHVGASGGLTALGGGGDHGGAGAAGSGGDPGDFAGAAGSWLAEAGEGGEGGAFSGCGPRFDPSSAPRVRLINVHGSSPAARDEPGTPTPFALQLRVNRAAFVALPAVRQQSLSSVSPYVDIAEGKTFFGVQTAPDGALPPVDALLPIDAKKGERYTVISLGSTVPPDIGEIGSGLIVLKDDLAAPSCDQTRLRFYQADTDALATDPTNNAWLTESLFVGSATEPLAVADPTQAMPAAGGDVPVGTRSFRVVPQNPAAAQPTGVYPFTAASDLLVGGHSYYVLSYPDPYRTDGLGERLMFVPIGDDSPPTLVALDPQLVFLNVASLPEAENLDVLVSGAPTAHNLIYLGADKASPDDSPTGGLSYAYVPPGGSTLTFAAAGSKQSPLLNTATGPLVPGQLYLGLISQAPAGASSALSLNLKRVALALPPPSLPEPTATDPGLPGPERAIFVNGSSGSPALDFGSFVANANAPGKTHFAPVIQQVAYGELSDTTSSLLPIAYLEPLEGAFGARLAVQSGADAASNRSLLGFDGYFPRSFSLYVYVAVGDWSQAAGNQLLQFKLFGSGVASARRPGFLSPMP